MSIHTNSLFILLLICGVSCTSVPNRLRLTAQKEIDVEAFLDVSPETHVMAIHLSDHYGEYLLIYSEGFQKGVVFDVEQSIPDGALDVRNAGFGSRLPNGQWNLYSEGKNGVRYESEGGQWTLQHFATLLDSGLKQKTCSIALKDLIRKGI